MPSSGSGGGAEAVMLQCRAAGSAFLPDSQNCGSEILWRLPVVAQWSLEVASGLVLEGAAGSTKRLSATPPTLSAAPFSFSFCFRRYGGFLGELKQKTANWLPGHRHQNGMALLVCVCVCVKSNRPPPPLSFVGGAMLLLCTA